jgi:hypothetical protein
LPNRSGFRPGGGDQIGRLAFGALLSGRGRRSPFGRRKEAARPVGGMSSNSNGVPIGTFPDVGAVALSTGE